MRNGVTDGAPFRVSALPDPQAKGPQPKLEAFLRDS